MNNWPPDFNLPDDYCASVLAGEYDLPYEAKAVLDIGANVGAFARWAAQKWPTAHIRCYEPQPENFRLLKKTLDHYFPLSCAFHAVESAVADKSGQMTLHENGNQGEWSLVHFVKEKTGQVQVQVIDAATLPDADFIKIDTEGAEPAIIKRLLDTGKLSTVGAVVLEYHSALSVVPLIWMCYEAGLRLHSVIPIMDHRGIMKFLR